MSSNNLPFPDPYNNIFEDSDNEFVSRPFDPLDDSWSLYQEILQSSIAPANDDHEIIHGTETAASQAIHVDDQQRQYLETVQKQDAQVILGNGLKMMRISTTSKSNSTGRKKSRKINNNIEDAEEGPSSSVPKKQLDHNAKERLRRMKLNASFLAMRALLPDSRRRSKKRWSAPAVVDRVLKYIPELENEIEELISNKENIIQSAAPKDKNYEIINPTSELYQNYIPTVSVSKVDKEEAIIQICMANGSAVAFTNLLQSVEDQGICINSASSLHVCETRICYHLHVQINQESEIEELKDMVISWLK